MEGSDNYSSQAKPSQAKPSQAKPSQAKPSQAKPRESNIELLKIIAIIFIVLSHSMPDGDVTAHFSAINLGASNSIQYEILQIMHNLGQIGNDIFLVCSFWFLLSSKGVKGHKIVSLMIDAFIVSVVSLLIFTLFGFEFPLKYVVKQFSPNLWGNSWFLACYLLIYAIHPGLNIIIDSMKNKTLILIASILGMMYCVIYFVLKNYGFYYNELIGFIVIYFSMATVKRVGVYKRISKRTMLMTIAVSGLLMIAINYVSVEIKDSLYDRWNNFINPLFIVIAFSSFGIAMKTKIATSKVINYLSSLSLLIYITHTNRIMRDYVRFEIFDWIKLNYSYEHLLAWCLLFFVFLMIYGLVFAGVYNITLQKLSKRLAGHVNQKLSRFYDSAYLKYSTYWMKAGDNHIE